MSARDDHAIFWLWLDPPSVRFLLSACMATLTRPRDPSEDNSFHVENDLILGIPKPFPTPAEREQEDLLDSLASEELRLEEDVGEEDGSKGSSQSIPQLSGTAASVSTLLPGPNLPSMLILTLGGPGPVPDRPSPVNMFDCIA